MPAPTSELSRDISDIQRLCSREDVLDDGAEHGEEEEGGVEGADQLEAGGAAEQAAALARRVRQPAHLLMPPPPTALFCNIFK